MPYPARLLEEGEEVVSESKQHWVALRDEIIYGVAWSLLLIVFVPWLDFPLDEWLAWAITAVWIYLTGSGVAKWLATDFVITSKRLVYRTGIFSKVGHEVRLGDLNMVDVQQSRVQRAFGAGDLLIATSSTTGPTVIRDVDDPHRLKSVVDGLRESRGRGLRGEPRPTLPEIPATGTSTRQEGGKTRAEQLEIIARLNAEGKLSDAEFAAEKRRILEAE